MKKYVDLTAKTFGRLHVIEEGGIKEFPSGQKRRLWKCKCECGNERTVLESNLKNGKTTSCGCLQKERTSFARRSDLTNKIFGKLTAVKFSHSDEVGQSYWLCNCECGNTKTINTASLKDGRSKSCGCKQGRFIHGMWGKPGYKSFYLKDPVKKIKHNIGVSVRDALKSIGISKKGHSVFDFLPYTPQQLKDHLENQFEDWMSWENYGGANDNPEKSWHIDHIKPHSSFSYTSFDEQQFQECWSLSNLRPLEKNRKYYQRIK